LVIIGIYLDFTLISCENLWNLVVNQTIQHPE